MGRIMVPKDVYVLIPSTYEYITLLGKRDFEDVARIWRWEDLLNYLNGPNVITRGRQGGQRQKRKEM